MGVIYYYLTNHTQLSGGASLSAPRSELTEKVRRCKLMETTAAPYTAMHTQEDGMPALPSRGITFSVDRENGEYGGR